MDPSLPHLSAFVAKLPQGLASFPAVQAKASLYRSILDAFPPDADVHLPEPLRERLLMPTPVSAWIPEVHSHAMVLALRDLSFDSDVAFVDFCYQQQKALFEGRLYRIMLALASPALLFRTAALRWNFFHRGTTLEVQQVAGHEARICVRHPPQMWDGLLADALMAGLRAVLDLSGAQEPRLEVIERTPEALYLRGTWR
jgi:hypothetical protein